VGLFAGGALPAAVSQRWLRRWLEALSGRPLEETAVALAALNRFSLGLADEVCSLARALGLLC
jgi:hypothetical protein